MALYTNRDAQTITTGAEIGRGGEGVVYQVVGRSDLVAKIYHPAQRTHLRHAKVTAMLVQPPQDGCRALTPPHVSLAWPTDLLFEGGDFAGFLMPRIERSPTIVALFNPLLRRQRYPQADTRFLYHTAQNLAAVLAALHSRGHVVGDLNQKNILVKGNTLVTLVDTDSFQISDGNGHTFHCPVGVPDYTPPELQGQPLAEVDRQPYHDGFGLSVLLFQLLMEGYHPFTGRPVQASLSDVEQLSLHCMQHGIFPYSRNDQVQPPPAAPDFLWLPAEIRRLFLQSFLVGYTQPLQRPTAATWAQALGRAEAKLTPCRRERTHWYSNHLEACPFCARQPKVTPVKPPIFGFPKQAPSLVGLNKPPAPSPAPVSAPVTVPGCLGSVLKVGGTVYLGFVLLMLLRNGWWPLLIIALVIALRTPAVRQKLWPATVSSWRWIGANCGQIGRGTVVGYRWLRPRAQHLGHGMLAFWIGGPTIVKELTAIALLIGFLVLLNYFSTTTYQTVPPSPTSPLVASPLATPTTAR